MVAARWFKVGIGPSWELVDALVRLCSLRKVLPLRSWLSVSRAITADLTWPGQMTEMPKRTRTWVLDDPYRPPTPMVAHLAISIHIIYTLAQTKIRQLVYPPLVLAATVCGYDRTRYVARTVQQLLLASTTRRRDGSRRNKREKA